MKLNKKNRKSSKEKKHQRCQKLSKPLKIKQETNHSPHSIGHRKKTKNL